MLMLLSAPLNLADNLGLSQNRIAARREEEDAEGEEDQLFLPSNILLPLVRRIKSDVNGMQRITSHPTRFLLINLTEDIIRLILHVSGHHHHQYSTMFRLNRRTSTCGRLGAGWLALTCLRSVGGCDVRDEKTFEAYEGNYKDQHGEYFK